MRIFTERAFQEELNKRRKEREKEEWMSKRFRDMEEQYYRLEKQIEQLRMEVSHIRDGDKE